MNPMMRWSKRLLIASLLAGWAIWAAQAQTSRDYSDDPFNEDLENLGAGSPAISQQLRFRLIGEIDLPGPLPGPGPRVIGERVEIPVAGGVASIPPEPGATAEIIDREPGTEVDTELWVVSPHGKRRFRTSELGQILAEKRCDSCESGWKKRWRHRLPANRSAPPLLHEKRLFVAAMDNIIYCMKAGNGHQLWTSDVGGRTSRRLVVWTGRGTGWVSSSSSPLFPVVILVVPDSGAELGAINAKTGQRVARLYLERGEGTLVGVPAITADGKILVAHQKYAESEAALRIYELDVPGQTPQTHLAPVVSGPEEPVPPVEEETKPAT